MDYTLTFTKKAYDLARLEADATGKTPDAILDRMAKHNLAYAWFIAEYGKEEGKKRFKCAWYQPPSPYHASLAQVYYKLPYQALCCQRKRAIDTMCSTMTKAALDAEVLDGKAVDVAQDTLTIVIEE